MTGAPTGVLGKHPQQDPRIASRVLAGEAVVVTPHDSLLHQLDEVGTFLWERATGERPLSALVDELCESYEVDRETAERDAEEFVQALVERGMLVLKDPP